MASFARSFIAAMPGLRPAASPRHLPFLSDLANLSASRSRSRLLTISARCRAPAANPAARSTKPSSSASQTHKAPSIPRTPGSPTATPATPAAPSRYAFIKSLASKPTPTTLYEGPSHFWFYFGCWTSGAFLIGWTALTGPNVVFQPQGVPSWVGYVFGAAYMILGAMGFYILSKTPNIVHSIRIIPSPSTAAAAAATASKTLPPRVAATTAPQIEVAVKRMVPLLEPKVLTTSLDNVSMQSRFSLPSEYVPDLRRRALEREDKARREALFKFDMEHLLTMPFRRLGRAFVAMFKGVRSAWTDSGFGVLHVDGKNYKVDVTQGFAHDGFRTLERLVPVDSGK